MLGDTIVEPEVNRDEISAKFDFMKNKVSDDVLIEASSTETSLAVKKPSSKKA